MKIEIYLIICLVSTSACSQRLDQHGADFKIEYLNEEMWQQGHALGSKLSLDGLTDINGNVFSHDEFDDKVVAVKFWFVGCRGCKQEEEYIRQVTKHFNDQSNVIFISISMTSENKITKYYLKNGDFGYRTISMKRHDIEYRFKVRTSPTHWFFKNGKLVDMIIGPIYSKEAKDWMIKYLEELQG